MSWFMWLIVLIVAFFQYEKGINFLNSFKPNVQGMLPGGGNEGIGASHQISPIKSDNYVPSTMEEQKLLAEFEEDLLAEPSKKGPSDSSRWYSSHYSPATSLPDSVFFEVSRMILCSNGLHPNCEDLRELVKNCLYGIKNSSKIIFGFRMTIEDLPRSAAHLRIKLHEKFKKKIWPAIGKVIDFASEEREIIFVGYETGGSLASLAAWRTIKEFEREKESLSIIKNGNNQIKVITWDETPLFTHKTARKSPLLPRNHSRFTSFSITDSIFRRIAQSSGGIDEIQYFSTSGDLIPIKSSDYNDFSSRTKKKSDENNWNPVSHLPLYIKEKSLKEDLSQQRLEELAKLLSLHHDHLSILHDLISNNYRVYISDSILLEPSSCVSALTHQLSNIIFPGSTITCRIDEFKIEKGSFKILCSYKTVNGKTFAQFLTFDAVLGDQEAFDLGNNCLPFMEEVEIEKPSKKKSKDKNKNKKKKKVSKALEYNGPAPVVDSWSNCIYNLFEQKEQVPLISPYTLRRGTAYPRCSYLPFAASNVSPLNSATRNTGCYLRAPNISHELLQIYRSDPNFFYSAIDLRLMKFPVSCKKVLFHIPFKANERVGLESLQQVVVDYLTQIQSKNPIADSEVTLWRARDTESFKTLAFFGTTDISEKHLSRRSFYQADFENSIIKCLSSPSYPYRDCTNPQNRWVPMACPAACSQTHGAINFLCKQVKSCPLAGYYISISSEGTVEQLHDIHKTLMKRHNPQFGIFNVQTRGSSHYSYFSSIFNLGLFRMPLNN